MHRESPDAKFRMRGEERKVVEKRGRGTDDERERERERESHKLSSLSIGSESYQSVDGSPREASNHMS